jgi:hypothetical protein
VYGSDVIPLQHVIPGALASALRRAPLSPEKVAFAWRTAVGAAVDRASAIELRGATLAVSVKSHEWQHEVARSTTLIRARLDAVLGPGVVTRIDVTVGESAR